MFSRRWMACAPNRVFRIYCGALALPNRGASLVLPPSLARPPVWPTTHFLLFSHLTEQYMSQQYMSMQTNISIILYRELKQGSAELLILSLLEARRGHAA